MANLKTSKSTALSKSELIIKLRTSKKVRQFAEHLSTNGPTTCKLRQCVKGAWGERLIDSSLRSLLAGRQIEKIRSMSGRVDGDLSCLSAALEGAADHVQKPLVGFLLLKFKTPAAAQRAAKRLNRDCLVDFAHQPATRQPMSIDPFRNKQWGLTETRLLSALKKKVKQPRDAKISVAVLDTGGPKNHPDFDGVLEHVNFSDGDDRFDGDAHGTHVCGIIGASANNDVGIAGYCSPFRILSVKGVLQPFTPSFREGAYHESLRYIVERAPNPSRDFVREVGRIKVINLSLGGEEPDETEKLLIRTAIRNNITVVAAMGNANSETPLYPASIHPDVIAVGATDESGQRWVDSSTGNGSNRGSHLKIMAPGVNILSTIPNHPTQRFPQTTRDNPYDTMTGSSMAAAFVSGAAALLYAKRPKASAKQIRKALQEGARTIAGKRNEIGSGLLDIEAALKKINVTSP